MVLLVTISKQIVDRKDRVFGFSNPCTYITVHETDNTSRGAGAQAHAAYQRNGGGGASWHYQVDGKQAIQSYSDSAQCFHAGDGRGSGNMKSVAIETCVNPDGDWAATKRNLVELILVLMKRHNVPVSRVVQHNHWSGKNCPSTMRANGNRQWNEVIAAVKAGGGGSSSTGSSSKGPSKPGKLDVDEFWGAATTYALQYINGTPADSVVSGQNAYVKKTSGGRFTGGWQFAGGEGSQLISKMQTYLKKKGAYSDRIDGLAAPNFQAGLIKVYGGKNLGEAVANLQRAVNKQLGY